MNKKLLLGLIPILMLASCDEGKTGFFDKTYKSGKNEIFYNLNRTFQGDTKTFKEVLKDKLTAGTVDWTSSGNCNESGTYIAKNFTQTSSYDALILDMETIAKEAFGNTYNDMNIVIGSFKDGKADGSITQGGTTKNVVYKPYNQNDGADATYLYIYDPSDLNNSIGSIDGCEGGANNNGKWDCICLGYEGYHSRTNFRFSFTDMSESYKIVVYAKIAN